MKRQTRVLLLALVGITSTACYRQVIETGATPGPVVTERTAATWIFGLVAAQEIDVRTICPTGVAVVETQQTFLNGLLGAITLGIYTPQTVRVTCAVTDAGGPDMAIHADATRADRVAALAAAIRESDERGQPVTLRY